MYHENQTYYYVITVMTVSTENVTPSRNQGK
jgi:hypothetical protein